MRIIKKRNKHSIEGVLFTTFLCFFRERLSSLTSYPISEIFVCSISILLPRLTQLKFGGYNRTRKPKTNDFQKKCIYNLFVFVFFASTSRLLIRMNIFLDIYTSVRCCTKMAKDVSLVFYLL